MPDAAFYFQIFTQLCAERVLICPLLVLGQILKATFAALNDEDLILELNAGDE